MLGFERVIPRHSESGNADVPNREPALELVMPGAVEEIAQAHRGHRPGGFKTRESSRIVDHVVRQKDLFASAGLHIAGGSVIEAAEDGDAGEEQDVFAVPETVRRRRVWRRRLRGGGKNGGEGKKKYGEGAHALFYPHIEG